MDGYVYLATDGELYKIGKTTDPVKRISGVRSAAPGQGRGQDVQMLHVFPCEDCGYAERFLHEKWFRQRKRGEWFDLSDDDVTWMCSIKVGDSSVFTEPDYTGKDWEEQLSAKVPRSLKRQLEQCVSRANQGKEPWQTRVLVKDVVVQALRDYIAKCNSVQPEIARRLSEEQ